MARKKKKGTSAKAAEKTPAGSSELIPAYVRFRTVLDAVEAGGLRYALSADSPEERVKRLKRLTEKLDPIAKRIRKASGEGVAPVARAAADSPADVGEPCPEGFWFCEGVCVPYPCPGGGDN